jgi:hypothetical protein
MQWTNPSSLRATKYKVCHFAGRLWHLYSTLQESSALYSCFEIRQQKWTFAVTCRANCIRLLAGRSINICHEVWSLSTLMQPHTVYSCFSHVTGNLRKIQHTLLTLHSGLFFLAHWHNTWEVTNCTARRIQEPNFCHDNFKNLANMRQVCQSAVGLCLKIMTPQWNNCASFLCVVVTVIQIMNTT